MAVVSTGAQEVYTLAWTREDGRPLPSRIVDDGNGALTIRAAQTEDAGTYVCTGSDYMYASDTDFAELVITGRPPPDTVIISYRPTQPSVPRCLTVYIFCCFFSFLF